MDDQNFPLATKARNPYIAFVLSLVVPGLAQVYNGQLKKGILLFVVFLLVPVLFGLFGAASTFYGYTALFLIVLLFRIFVLIDGVVVAKRQQKFIPKVYNTWYYHLIIALVLITVFWIYDTKSILGVQSNIMPTPANEPTIRIDDRVITDLRAYTNKQPDYGDIIVYKNERDIQFAFRVAGLPNDTIDINQQIVTINGIKSKSTFIGETTTVQFEVSEFEEEFPNGNRHHIFKTMQPMDSSIANMKNIIVPANSYFVLGDNRDNASDSRYEGFVKRDRIIGRVLYSYWGKTIDRMNIDFRGK